ncbi:NAD(P)-dependent oxidoreductase [Bullifex sp.]|uniref:NAD-dependent epimerase/dehydratase family protein n=1 Tax=Bullifex sp. TaxID=2815808 RepID=UPI002A7F569D|nr:NAD(P)-dependent oxidoreductase [Bullifex sp.]MDY4067025.1 NAD(P)-dependent oxidoreductase [Bullifex sp.]
MKRAIITGATGAIGTALVNELIKNKVEVLVICRGNSNRNINIPDSPLVSKLYCDLKDLSSLKNNTGKEYDVFYHFAWMGTSGVARNDMYLQNQNVQYSLDAVGVAKRFKCRKFIGAGSQAEYGRVEGKLKAKTPTFPENGYGYAKLCAGQMTRDYSHQLGIEHVWTRILSIYGPNDGQQSMVMSTINKMINGEIPQFTKGEQMWDYLYSGDAARAFFLLGERGVDGKTYVVGSGKVKPLAEYIKDIQRIVNPKCEIQLGAIPYDDKQVMYLCADTVELEKDTGWKPSISFEEGIKNVIK